MRLTPRSTILLAPALALALLQLWAFASGLGQVHLENALIGIVILKSSIPIHGAPAFPWIIFPFLLLSIGFWELLETIRRPQRLASCRVIPCDREDLAEWSGRYLTGFGLAAAIVIVLDFVIATLLPVVHLMLETLSETGDVVFILTVGILCPLFLGYPALLSYSHWIRYAPT